MVILSLVTRRRFMAGGTAASAAAVLSPMFGGAANAQSAIDDRNAPIDVVLAVVRQHNGTSVRVAVPARSNAEMDASVSGFHEGWAFTVGDEVALLGADTSAPVIAPALESVVGYLQSDSLALRGESTVILGGQEIVVLPTTARVGGTPGTKSERTRAFFLRNGETRTLRCVALRRE